MAEATRILTIKSATEEAPAAPDSTTSMFVEGEDVLVDRNHTGQFFMGTIVQIDRVTEKCLLRFLDNKECWAHLNELQRVKDDPEEILCVVCKKVDQTVVRCPKCGRGYHRSCLELSIPDGVPAAKWLCLRCGNKNLKKKRSKLSLGGTQLISDLSISHSSKCTTLNVSNEVEFDNACVVQKPLAPSSALDVPHNLLESSHVRSFPYSLPSLIWDELHRVNEQQQYCYCGKPGDWYMQMLQCFNCRQWFHQDCLSCLHFPLYCGDQLYLFLCSVCNDVEFLRRFDFGWVDIVHLVIFNLVLFKKKKYFDVEREIIPYVKNNWFYLQIPAQLVKCSDAELRRIILKMLEDNSTKNCRFKSGKELRTKKRIWGLRMKVPPKRIPFSLPPVRPLTDEAVKVWWKNCHISFREPLDSKYLMRFDKVLHPDGRVASFEYGLILGNPPNSSNVTSRNLKEAAVGVHLLDTGILRNKFTLPISVNGMQVRGQSTDSFTGYAKKSSAFCASNRLTLQESLRRNRRAHRNRMSPRSKVLGKKEVGGGDQSDDVQENSSQDGSDSLDSLTSFSQDDNYVSSNAISQDEESLDDELSQGGYDSSVEESDAGTEECASISTRLSIEDCQSVDSHDEFKGDVKEYKETDVKVTVEEVESIVTEKVTPLCKDEVQSEPVEDYALHSDMAFRVLEISQLTASPVIDKILPSVSSTPADTEVEEDSRGPSEIQPSHLPTIADLIGLPIVLDKEPTAPLIPSLPRLTPVIKEPPQARPVKRKLSEKDIKIVNGQVKQKRRLRRFQSNQSFGTKTVHLDSGEKLEKRIVGGKLLRSPHKPPILEPAPDINPSQGEPSSAASTNFVRPEEMSVSDVKRNIKSIFNARNRIAAGEKFLIKGRRVTADGVEYLIQWDYPL